MKHLGWLFVLPIGAALYISMADPAHAQDYADGLSLEGVTADLEEDVALDVHADRIEFDSDRHVMIGIGNVRIQQDDEVLTADYVEFHTGTRDALARGDVRFERGREYWTGDEMRYNFRTRTGDFGAFRAFSDPYHISAQDSSRDPTGDYHLRRVSVTTCNEEDEREFVIRARRARIADGSILHARHAVAHLYRIPVFYTPYWRKNFAERSHIDFLPGYSSRMGAFLLTGYRYYPTSYFRSRTQLDYRTKRGFGYGQNFRWRIPGDRGGGKLRAYYADDKRPIQTRRQARVREGLVDSDRYRIGLTHNQMLGDRQMFMSQFTYLSDPFVQEDFFEDEYRASPQPENRVTLSHRGDNYTAGLLFNMRLNDFYGNVNRLPEAFLNVSRQQIFDSPFYYEGRHSAAYLERVHPKGSGRDDYDAFRADTLNRIYYPTRHFGFLNVTPNVGYRSTYYSETLTTERITEWVDVVDEDGEPVVTEDGDPVQEEVESTVSRPAGADVRHLFELGLETSYKAFRVYTEAPNYLGEGLRHIAEPYARYTYVSRPNLRPQELYAFDGIDRLDKRHEIRFGARNKLQTRRPIPVRYDPEVDEEPPRRRSRVHDMIDLDTYTIFRVEPEEGQKDFANFFFDARLHPADWVRIRCDGEYDWHEGEIARLNTQMAFVGRDRSTVALEYRYQRDRRELLMGEVSLFPEQRWSLNAYWRYNLGENDLEEQSYLLERRFHCTGLGLGVRERRDEIRVYAQIWLLAFDRSEMQLGR